MSEQEGEMFVNPIINEYLEEIREEICRCADQIHDLAEPSGGEVKSAEVLCSLLERHGFFVERGLPEQPTAFRAVYGTGKAAIGLMCEYDALPGLQNEACPYQKGDGGYGHGCGHNLLGAASAAAGIALKHAIEETGLAGRIVVYGTPAEETLEGKTIMIEHGAFRELDACIAWHPLDRNECGEVKYKAIASVIYEFHGVTAHACGSPEMGRSALDAVELMSVGCNYLREHIDKDSFLHYSYLNGGLKPNIVPDYASVWYYVRAFDHKKLDVLLQRVCKVAEGAAMMTETAVEHRIAGYNRETVLNRTLTDLIFEEMTEIGAPHFTEEEKEYARKIAKQIGQPGVEGELEERIKKPDGKIFFENGSTDMSDVSQIVPTVNFNTVCYGKHSPNHHWGITAQTKGSAAHKGMMFAAKVMANAGERLLREPELLQRVRDEFLENRSV